MLILMFFVFLVDDVTTSLADIDRLQHDLSRFLSVSRFTESEKTRTREAIETALLGVGLHSFTQTFFNEETGETGSNVISIQPGPNYGTPDDKFVVLCANYDTKEDNPGVDDNGSGVATVLETARAMATLDRLYARLHTLLYVFVDLKAAGMAGSHAFVEEMLLPLVGRANASVEAVLVLDGVLNFDPFPSTQATPQDFDTLFPVAAKELHDHKHMGDFLMLIAREKLDHAVMQNFVAAFARTGASLNDWSFRPWLLPLNIQHQQMTSLENLYKLHPYLYADHSSFYFHSKRNVTFPTLYITDTLSQRGVNQYCPHCDGLYMLTEQNMKFLAFVTDTVIRTVIQLSVSEATAILDDLYTSMYRGMFYSPRRPMQEV